jgi:histidine triad (HIT) family protein
MAYEYDDQNIFAKILRGEIPNNTVLETDYCLAFHDIGPQAPIHVLVIPKGPYVNWDHFVAEASADEVVGYSKGIHAVVAELGLEPGEGGNGYRLIMNAGEHGMQEVPHLHVHIVSGRPLGRMIAEV